MKSFANAKVNKFVTMEPPNTLAPGSKAEFKRRHPMGAPKRPWAAAIQRFCSPLTNSLFPMRCGGCQAFWSPPHTLGNILNQVSASYQEDRRGRAAKAMANWFCPTCRENFTWVASPICSACGRMFPSRTGHDHLCSECTLSPPNFHQARAWGIYDGSLKTVIQKFKYRGQIQWADPLGLFLYLTAHHHGLLEACDLILPVPLHASRLRYRGFNQAYLMLRKWQSYKDRLDPRNTLAPINPNFLQRRRPTAPQTGLPPKERKANVRGAFQLDDPQGVLKGKRVLLVDDVLTTGATVMACVQALKRKGPVARVDVLTLARPPGFP